MATLSDTELPLVQRLRDHAYYGEEFVAILDGPNFEEVMASLQKRRFPTIEFLVADSALCAVFGKEEIMVPHASGIESNIRLLTERHPEFSDQVLHLIAGFTEYPRIDITNKSIYIGDLFAVPANGSVDCFWLSYVSELEGNAYAWADPLRGQFQVSCTYRSSCQSH